MKEENIKIRIMLVFGTRPEAIKMAPLVLEFQKYENLFETIVTVTGQHREMLDQVLKIFKIKPDYDLCVMRKDQDLYDVYSSILLGMREVLLKTKPQLVFVHGDTITSTATAMAAFFQQIKVAHVEAGLRTNDIFSPWPEEMNRQVTSRIASFHFAPTLSSKQNLIAENVKSDIIITGNTVIDALLMAIKMIKDDQRIESEIIKKIAFEKYDVDRIKRGQRLVLITGHRRENFGSGFRNICQAIKVLSEKYSDVDFLYPVHLNPNVQKPVYEILGQPKNSENVFLIKPLEYLPFIFLMDKSTLILTDSGGIQEEAPSLGKLVLVMRDVTERPEAMESGIIKLVGTESNSIIANVSKILDLKDKENQQVIENKNPYGDGTASEKIVDYFIKNIKRLI